MSSQIPTDENQDGFAIYIDQKVFREFSCMNCGYPFLTAGKRCRKCEADYQRKHEVIGMALPQGLAEHFASRDTMVHSFKHGLIDPNSREGKQLLDG